MALWGKKDQIVFNTSISVTNGDATVTTTGDFTAANDNLVKAGDLLRISGVDYRVAYVTSATSLELTSVYAGTTATVSAASVIRRPIPKYWLQGQDSITQDIYFVDNTEASLTANKNRGLNSPGWWQYYEYTDAAGNTRYKTELLVAFSETAANASDYADDTDVADSASTVTISGQPTNQTTYTPAGAILTTTTAGTAVAGTANYTITNLSAGVVVTNVSGGAAPSGTWSLAVSRTGGTYSVTVNTGGANFAATDTILIPGDLLGGAASTNDLTVTVATVATAAATFTVTASASAGSVLYQWQRQTATGTTWTNILGETSASLALTGLVTGDNGRKYRVKLTSTEGAAEVISNTATLTVTAA